MSKYNMINTVHLNLVVNQMKFIVLNAYIRKKKGLKLIR